MKRNKILVLSLSLLLGLAITACNNGKSSTTSNSNTGSGQSESVVNTNSASSNSNSSSGSSSTSTTPVHEHDYDEGVVTQEPTCTEKGVKTFTCKTDSSHTKTEEIPALGHKLDKVVGVLATCDAAGTKEHYECSVCHSLFSDEKGENPVTADSLVIPQETTHSITKVDFIEPTTTTYGYKEHYQCASGKELYADGEGTTPITLEELQTPMVTGPDKENAFNLQYTDNAAMHEFSTIASNSTNYVKFVVTETDYYYFELSDAVKYGGTLTGTGYARFWIEKENGDSVLAKTQSGSETRVELTAGTYYIMTDLAAGGSEGDTAWGSMKLSVHNKYLYDHPAQAKEYTVGETKQLPGGTFTFKDEDILYKFTANETGPFLLEVQASKWAKVYLYDSNNQELANQYSSGTLNSKNVSLIKDSVYYVLVTNNWTQSELAANTISFTIKEMPAGYSESKPLAYTIGDSYTTAYAGGLVNYLTFTTAEEKSFVVSMSGGKEKEENPYYDPYGWGGSSEPEFLTYPKEVVVYLVGSSSNTQVLKLSSEEISEVTGSFTSVADGQYLVVLKYTDGKTATPFNMKIEEHVHSYDAGVITTPATCTVKGVKTYTCFDCGHSYTEEIDMVEHDIKATTLFTSTLISSGTHTYYQCSVGKEYYEDALGNTPMTLASNTTLWTLDESNNLKNTNHGMKSSYCDLTFTVSSACDLSFDYVVDTENSDKLRVYVNGKESTFKAVGGQNVSGNCKLLLNASDLVRITYAKDSSVDKYSDTVLISNLSLTEASYATVTLKYADGSTADGTIENIRVGLALTGLTDATREGYYFDGWFAADNTQYTTATIVEGDVELTARWTQKIIVTLHLENGFPNIVKDYRINSDWTYDIPEYDGHVFEGWYTSPELTDESKYELAALTKNLDLYAKYTKAPDYVGKYAGIEVYGSSGAGNKSTNKTGEVKATNELYHGTSSRGTLDMATLDLTTGKVNLDGGDYAYLFQSEKLLVYNYSSGKTDPLTNDLFIMARTTEQVTFEAQSVWAKGEERLVHFSVGSVNYVLYINSATDRVYCNVTLSKLDGTELKVNEVYDTATKVFAENLVIKQGDETIVEYAFKNGDYAALDEVRGTYTCDGSYTIELNGAGSATVGSVTTTYTIVEEQKVELVIDNKTRAITLDKVNHTYAFTTDGTEGTYTGEFGDFVSTGDGTGTLAGAAVTYVKDGLKLIVTKGDSTQQTIVLDGTAYLTNSIFSGHEFNGSYIDMWNDSASLRIVFQEGAEIGGTFYAGGPSFYFDFTATLEGTTLTMTVTRAVDSGAVGKVITASVVGNKITILTNGITNGAYSIHNNGSATSTTFTMPAE